MKHTVEFFEKHPDEDAALVSVSWASYLTDAGVTISTSEWSNVSASPAVTLSGEGLANNGTVTTVKLDGGIDGAREYLENHVTFSDGSDAVYTLVVIVTNKRPG